MRYVFMGLFVGLVVGAFLPAEPALGVNCAQTINSHVSGLTSCAAEYEDYNGSPGLVCIWVNEVDNVADTLYYNQCESLGTGDDADYTVQVQRIAHAEPSEWETASYIGGAACTGTLQVHPHSSSENGDFTVCD
jgi:hypothetical protein